MPTVSYQGTNRDVRRLIFGLVAGLSGRDDEFSVLVTGIKLRIGLTALQLVSEAFDDKSEHGAGSDGIQWAELSPETIARRRLGPGDEKMLKGEGIHPTQGLRPFLTPAQDARWKRIFAQVKARMMGRFGMDEGAASARAGQAAWSVLKAEGARTKLEVLGSRFVQIGKDTGRLAASLSPGIEDPGNFPLDGTAPPPETVSNSKPGDRILVTTDPGKVIVGTAVEYAERFSAKRPLWPSGGALPAAWEEELSRVCGSAVSEAIVRVLQEAA